LLIVSEPPESDGGRWRDPEVEATGLKWQKVLLGVAVLLKTRMFHVEHPSSTNPLRAPKKSTGG
jgi:hypothetical protein